MLGNKIGDMTLQELQAIIQTSMQFSPSSLPASFSMRELRSGEVGVAGQLDFTEEARVAKNGIPFPPLSFLGVGYAGAVEPMYAELWQAAGGKLVSQVSDLPDQTDIGGLVNQRLHSSLLYVPTRSEVNHIHVWSAQVPTTYTGTTSAIGLSSIGGTPTSPTITRIDRITNVATGGIAASTGLKTFNFAKTLVLDAGVYVASVILNWASFTGSTPGLASRNALSQEQNGSLLGGYGRTFFIDTQVDVPASWTPAGNTQNRIWFALST